MLQTLSTQKKKFSKEKKQKDEDLEEVKQEYEVRTEGCRHTHAHTHSLFVQLV